MPPRPILRSAPRQPPLTRKTWRFVETLISCEMWASSFVVGNTGGLAASGTRIRRRISCETSQRARNAVLRATRHRGCSAPLEGCGLSTSWRTRWGSDVRSAHRDEQPPAGISLGALNSGELLHWQRAGRNVARPPRRRVDVRQSGDAGVSGKPGNSETEPPMVDSVPAWLSFTTAALSHTVPQSKQLARKTRTNH